MVSIKKTNGELHTEGNAVSYNVYPYTEKGSEADREEKVETRHPSAEDSAFLEPLL